MNTKMNRYVLVDNPDITRTCTDKYCEFPDQPQTIEFFSWRKKKKDIYDWNPKCRRCVKRLYYDRKKRNRISKVDSTDLNGECTICFGKEGDFVMCMRCVMMMHINCYDLYLRKFDKCPICQLQL